MTDISHANHGGLRRVLKWWALPLIIPAAFAVLLFSLLSAPSKWDGATAIKICRDGTPILRLTDGSVWARRSAVLAYRVEDQEKICGQ